MDASCQVKRDGSVALAQVAKHRQTRRDLERQFAILSIDINAKMSLGVRFFPSRTVVLFRLNPQDGSEADSPI